MQVVYTRKFVSMYKELPALIKRKAEKQEALFRVDMFPPSLNTEKLSPKHANMWSFRVDMAYRVIFHLSKNIVVFLYIGHHKDIYRFKF